MLREEGIVINEKNMRSDVGKDASKRGSSHAAKKGIEDLALGPWREKN
jgi:hypothetical protein